MHTIRNLSIETVRNAELRYARSHQMAMYRNNAERAQHADAPYVPHRIDALGLYRIAGQLQHLAGNLLDGFYAVDDFGQLARVDLEAALAVQ
jgi:hypothetical protein